MVVHDTNLGKRHFFVKKLSELLNKESFKKEVIECIGKEAFEKVSSPIFQEASVGRKLFNKKFGWIEEYKEEIEINSKMIQLVNILEGQVKQKGINKRSRQLFVKNTAHIRLNTAGLKQFKEKMSDYLAEESAKVPKGQSLLATTETIESIFGKYKWFSEKKPFKEIGPMILIIPIFTVQITSDLVVKAMGSVKNADLKKWRNEIFGQSKLSKRRDAFNFQQETIEQEEDVLLVNENG